MHCFFIFEQDRQKGMNLMKQFQNLQGLVTFFAQFQNINLLFKKVLMRFGLALSEITIPQWKQCYINYQILKIFVSVIKILAQLTKKCDEAITTVSESKENNFQISLQGTNVIVLDQLSGIKKEIGQYFFLMNREFYRIFFIQTEIIELFYQMKTLEIEDRYRVISRLKDRNFIDRKLELYLTYIEYAYIEISYLSQMRQANLQAQRKILKKHKKYAKNVVMTPSSNHDKISRMTKIQEDYTNKIENLYVQQNKHLQSKEARQFLRLAAHKEQPSEKDYFFMGVGVGASIIVLGTLIVIILQNKLSVQNNSKFATDFPTWRGIGIFILYFWVLGFNLYFFQKYKISHRLIFKFDDHHYSTSADLVKLAGIFTTIFLAVFLLYLLRISNVHDSQSAFGSQYYVLLVYGIVFLYLLVPLPIFNHKGRIFSLKLIGKSLISPIAGMTFQIAWMTDQWISLSTPLRDLAYTFCYYTRLDFNNKGEVVSVNPCKATSTFEVALLLIIVPLVYRLLQCIRWGISDGFWCTDHMFNAIKYGISLCSAVFSYLYKLNSSLLVGWIVFAAVGTLYSYYWDLKKDWNLLEPNCKNFLLRKYITFQPKRNYYIIFALNFIMRLSWAITLSPAITSLFGDPNLLTFTTGSIQIVRRGIWNLLRVEREHIKNCVQFKAIPDMSHIQQSLDQEYVQTQGVIGVRNKEHIKSREIVKKQFIELLKKKLEKREAEEKYFNEDYQEKSKKKVKKIGKKLIAITDKFKKVQ